MIAGCSGDGDDSDGTAEIPAEPGDTEFSEIEVQSGPVSNFACTGGTPSPSDITDIILATGQSNLIGPDTVVAATIDQFGKVVEFQQPDLPHPRVFAWNVDPTNNNAGIGWKTADLTQSWHKTCLLYTSPSPRDRG